MNERSSPAGHSYRRLLCYLVIGAVALAVPLVVRAARERHEYNQIRPLVLLAAQRAAEHERSSGSLKLAVGSYRLPSTATIVNWPTADDDARIEFTIPYNTTYAKVLARGRQEDGQWRLTHVETQPQFGSWYVDQTIGGYEYVGKLPVLPERQ